MGLINKADPMWPRVVEAFAAIAAPVPAGLTDDEHAENRIVEFMRSVVRNYESTEKLKPPPEAVAAAASKVEEDFASYVKKPAPPAPKEE